MTEKTSILVVADGSGADHTLLAKAAVLARGCGAQVHLYTCDTQLARALRHSNDPKESEKAWAAWQDAVAERMQYLESLRDSAQVSDIHMSVEAACDGPLCDVVVNKALEWGADLVMKSPSGAHPLRRLAFDSSDWQLMRTCPATLMLVGGRNWQVPPRFAALVDLADEESTRLAEAIVDTAAAFGACCGAELELVYSEAQHDASDRHAVVLQRLAQKHRIEAPHVHLPVGDPHQTLPEFVSRHHYDTLVLGGLTHRKGLASLTGTLTSRLVEALECDFMLVRPAPASRGEPSATSEGRSSSTVAWQALFGD